MLKGKYVLIEVLGGFIQNKTNQIFDNEDELKKWLLNRFEKNNCYDDFNKFIEGYVIFDVNNKIKVTGKKIKWDICIGD